MTNSQESDSIAEKPEVVKTKAKPNRWNWKTAIAVTLTAAINAVSLASAILQPIRRRINQWNWRKKTALVTALAITAAGNFVYQYRANAAWPAVIAAAYGTDFFVKLFTGYAITQGLNAAFNTAVLKETAVADTDKWLYSKRKYYRRDYSYSDNGATTTTDVRVDSTAEAAQNKTYDASGTDSRWIPSTLDADDVIDYYVNHNTHLNGTTEEYRILNDGEPLYYWDLRRSNRRYLETFSFSWGGYVQKLTAEEIQEELDYIRDDWNRYNYGTRYRQPRHVGQLTLRPGVSRTDKRFECEREVKLWSDFEHVAVPGSNDLSPTELEEPGSRSTYVTRLSYIAREAGYGSTYGMVVTKVPQNKRPRHEYPEPLSYTDDDFKRFTLTQIPWSSFKIIGTPTWVGRAKRFFKHRKIRWCLTHNIKRWPGRGRRGCRTTIKHEYPVYQNENVIKP